MKINFLLTYIHTKVINFSNPVVPLFLTFESVDEIHPNIATIEMKAV